MAGTVTLYTDQLTLSSPTVSLYPDGSDTAAETGTSATEATNRKGTYTFSNATATGLHLIILISSATQRWYGWAVLATSGNIVAYDTRDEAIRMQVTASTGVQDVNTTKLAGTDYGSADFSATMKASINAEADTALSDWGKTGFSLTAGTGLGNQTADITGSLSGSVGSVAGAVGSVTGNVGGNVVGSVASVVGAVGSVTGNVGGNVAGSVGSVTGDIGGNLTGTIGGLSAQAKADVNAEADAALTDYGAAKPGDEMDLVDAPNATAVTAIQGGLSTLDAAGVRSAVGLASANLDTQIADLPTVAEFEARTIVAANYFDPATDQVIVATNNDKSGYSITGTITTLDALDTAQNSQHSTTQGLVTTVAGYLDTEVAAILEDTGTTIPATLSTIAGYIDTEVAAIKAKTDNLPASPAATSDIPSAATVADAVWDEATSGHSTAGTFGKAVSDALTNTTTLLTRIPSTLFNGITSLAGWLRLAWRKDSAAATDYAASLAEINSDGGSGSGSFSNATDSQEAAADASVAQTGDSYAYLTTNLGLAGANATEAGGTGDQFTGIISVGSVTSGVTVDMNNDKTGYTLDGSQSFDNVGSMTGDIIGNLTGSVNGDVDGTVASVVGSVGSVSGNVDGIVGGVAGTTQTLDALAILIRGADGDTLKSLSDQIDAIPTTIRVKKNTALSGFPVVMIDTAGDPATGKTVTGVVSLDGGGFSSLTNAVSEVSGGLYAVDLAAGDTNGDTLVMRFSASGCRTRFVEIVTQP